jgi:hypothetical protein
VSDDGSRPHSEQFTVSHFDCERLVTIQARSFYPNLFFGKQPADRQRLKPSLGVPFLRSAHGDPILRWKIRKGRKGNNVICAWMKPARKTCSH